MKHIKFEFAEPLVAIQRVRNEVFLGDDGNLWVLSLSTMIQLEYYLKILGIPTKNLTRVRSAYRKIGLTGIYRFVPNLETDEIIVMRGEDRIWVENELGEDVTPPSDLDIDEGYEDMCNRAGCELGL